MSRVASTPLSAAPRETAAQESSIDARVGVERVARLVRFVAAALILVFGQLLPNVGPVFVVTLGIFCIGYGLVIGVIWARARTADEIDWAERFTLTADISLVGFALLVFAPEPGWAVYASGFLVIASGGFRFRNGALLAAASLSLTYTLITIFRAAALGFEITPQLMALQLGSYVIAGLVMNAVLPEIDAMRDRALYDALTGLPNRALVNDRLSSALATAHRQHGALCLLLIDLDGFKEVNDTLGHSAGDRVLIEVASRLTGALRESDTAARLGGDEFVVLLPATALAGAIETAWTLNEIIAKPVAIGDATRTVSASIGIASFPEHGRDAVALFAAADAAMYEAKRTRAGWRSYDQLAASA